MPAPRKPASNQAKAELLRQIGLRDDLSPEERAVLREASALFSPPAEPARAPARAPAEAGAGGARVEAILWSDGAARGNPGPAGLGALLSRISGEKLAELSEYIGEATNNVAEYRALIMGLERARDLGLRRLEVRADSELMIKQLRGQYRVKNARLKPLYEQAVSLLRDFERVDLKHVRREFNSEADRLANVAIDSA